MCGLLRPSMWCKSIAVQVLQTEIENKANPSMGRKRLEYLYSFMMMGSVCLPVTWRLLLLICPLGADCAIGVPKFAL